MYFLLDPKTSQICSTSKTKQLANTCREQRERSSLAVSVPGLLLGRSTCPLSRSMGLACPTSKYSFLIAESSRYPHLQQGRARSARHDIAYYDITCIQNCIETVCTLCHVDRQWLCGSGACTLCFTMQTRISKTSTTFPADSMLDWVLSSIAPIRTVSDQV